MGGGQVGRILLFQTLKITIYHRKRPVRLVLLKGGEEGGGWTEEIFFLEGEVLPPSTKRKKRKKNPPVIGIENKEKETERERKTGCQVSSLLRVVLPVGRVNKYLQNTPAPCPRPPPHLPLPVPDHLIKSSIKTGLSHCL